MEALDISLQAGPKAQSGIQALDVLLRHVLSENPVSVHVQRGDLSPMLELSCSYRRRSVLAGTRSRARKVRFPPLRGHAPTYSLTRDALGRQGGSTTILELPSRSVSVDRFSLVTSRPFARRARGSVESPLGQSRRRHMLTLCLLSPLYRRTSTLIRSTRPSSSPGR